MPLLTSSCPVPEPAEDEPQAEAVADPAASAPANVIHDAVGSLAAGLAAPGSDSAVTVPQALDTKLSSGQHDSNLEEAAGRKANSDPNSHSARQSGDGAAADAAPQPAEQRSNGAVAAPDSVPHGHTASDNAHLASASADAAAATPPRDAGSASAPSGNTLLPKPPWITSTANSEAYAQLVQYAQKLEMDTALLLAQVIAQLMCTAQQVAWIVCHGDAGCAPVDAHMTTAVTRARDLLADKPCGARLVLVLDVLLAASALHHGRLRHHTCHCVLVCAHGVSSAANGFEQPAGKLII